jgi:hypothetical protein
LDIFGLSYLKGSSIAEAADDRNDNTEIGGDERVSENKSVEAYGNDERIMQETTSALTIGHDSFANALIFVSCVLSFMITLAWILAVGLVCSIHF